MIGAMVHQRLAVIHGPNLNLLGVREKDIYGTKTLEQINQSILSQAQGLGVEVEIIQTNHEGEMIDFLQNLYPKVDGAIINPAALGHTSIALRDAFLATKIPFIEVHLSNIYAREDFRRKTLLQDLALAVISGCGADGYVYALKSLVAAFEPATQTQNSSLLATI